MLSLRNKNKCDFILYSSHLIATLRLRLEDTFVQKNKRKTGFPLVLCSLNRIFAAKFR